ncbi:hypothetical protein [Candidatus Methylobacter oryzae]|uniref:Prepilin-type N-terminal cleavage/methylation domain-containing protein n=1 Tax=Candidatus Methylobacter oryzae TaxID=2497749 RepID=A0ABY3CGH4_9GAMM|nr:hypothetical protein [Candidatus Methylobacter oryzae]TRX02942.1 hypothetical protein EKO24_001260 [Candidatus Methylobacter oryzae]
MKFTFSAKNSTGIGLIEVLITTVVVAVGLLSVASLQGDLLGDSRSNKTRAEAQALANTKIEQLRDTIVQTDATSTTGYTQLASSAANESIAGTTETFTRSWIVSNQTGPVRKQVSVTVCWLDCSAENTVTVQSVIAFDGVGNSVLAAKGAGAAATTVGGPSTNANSSDEITENINIPASAGTFSTGGVYSPSSGVFYIVQNNIHKGSRAYLCSDDTLDLTPFENSLYTRRADYDGDGNNEAIYLYQKVTADGIDYCIPRVRFNGGVIIPIRGIVHSGATVSNSNDALLDVNLFTFNANESGTYCVFNPPTGAKSAPYVCYVGGNCENGPNGTIASGATEPDVTQCPDPAVANPIVGPGGWRGKVGLLGVAARGNNVCFAEEIAAAPATLDTARNYYARHNLINEGINKPYDCHDFLIINGKNTNAQVHSECVAQANAIGGFTLASKNIQRTISSTDNVFDPNIDTTFCAVTGTTYTITGTISNANSAPTVTVTDGVSTNACTASASSYTCSIQTSATSVTINGAYNAETKNCTISSLSSSSTSPTGCTLTFTATTNPTYTITGHINGTATAANAVSLILSGGGSCTVNNDNNGTYSTYTCTITTATTTPSVTLTPAITTGGTVTPNTAQTITLTAPASGTTATQTGPDFTATMATTYTISGSIRIGNNVSLTTVTVAVDTGYGTCTLSGTHAQNTNDSYSCTVPAGTNYSPSVTNHLSITLSSACTTGGGSKKYQITDGSTTSLGTGILIINLGVVSGNMTKTIDVTKSTTNC